tara:strand:- start:748 stop:1638 length:891 start_codon:yes stop_codon:yes gene_type:complete
MKYFIAIDIGGTTFNTGIFSESFNKISISDKDKIRNYKGKNEVIDAIISQVNSLINDNDINRSDILGLGIASPGPLDAKKGVILNTPNLKIFQNYPIANDFAKKLDINTYLENDANLFALGEWYTQYKNNDIIIAITIGTGLGFGLIINGKLFRGSHGMAMEYGLSPFPWGMCEKNVSIGYIRKRAQDLYGENLSPRVIEEFWYKKDKKAIKIYDEFGKSFGIVLSHVINMIDPQIITIGGGLSNAYDCFKTKMLTIIKENAPSFKKNKIIVAPSKLRELSSMVGACMMVKNRLKI